MSSLREELEARCLGVVESAIARYYEALVAGCLHIIREELGTVAAPESRPAEGEPAKWIPIASLHSLRKLVGGRFAYLKERWVNAGFPLKDSKREVLGPVEADPAGWQELRSWLLSRGFEARPATAAECLFEIRKTP